MPSDVAGRAVSKGRAARRPRKLIPSERAAIVGLLAVVFLAVLAFGASDVATAAVFSGVYALFLQGLVALCGWARRDVGRLAGLRIQASLFLVLLLAVLWPLTPWGPGGPHPVWRYLAPSGGSLTIDRSAVLLNILQFLGLACLFLAARIIGSSEPRGRWFFRIAVLVIGAYGAMAFVDYVAQRGAPRLTATLLSPNTAATVFGGGLLLALAALGNRLRRLSGLSALMRGDIEATASLAAAAVMATALLLTASRAGAAATLVAVALFLVWEAIAQRQKLKVATLLGGLALVLFVAGLALRSFNPLADRLELANGDVAVRAAIFAPHYEAFLSSPWFGFGLGSFVSINQLITTSASLPTLFNVRATHNLYLQWLEEGGVVGSLAMLALFVAIIAPVVKRGLQPGAVGAWSRAVVCGAVLFLLHGITDFALQVPAVQALAAMVLGVAVSLGAGRTPGSSHAARPWPIWGAQALAGGVGLAALLTAPPLLAAKLGGDLSAWPTAPAEALAAGIERGLAQSPSPARLTALKRLSDRELDLRPASGSAWLRLAAIEAARGDQAASNLALERSFAVAPLQSSLFTRRAVFAYEHWDVLSQSAREQTVYQLRAEWMRVPYAKPLIQMANQLRNPAGRVGLALQIAVLRMQHPPPPPKARVSN
ncbi:O-antigen ligase family protein [Caulobacter sp. CCG-8]|uniref:O-antigen ligase family protein n=1 Tax=Caulobacter sp. CCG-8 TaxID=3127958 RepID=UPI00307EABC7